MTKEFRGSQAVTWGYKGLQGVTLGLQEVARDYLQRVTLGLQEVARDYLQRVTCSYRRLQRVS